MKKNCILGVLWLFAQVLAAQEGTSAYQYLKIPVSSHVAATGGQNISIVDDDATLGMSNPALLSNVSDGMLSFDYTRYMAGANLIGAQYVKAFGQRHTGSVALHYLGYGSQMETDDQGNELGSFTPKDIVAQIGYSYLLTDRWSGGAAMKILYSHYAGYTSAALAVDVGVNYFNEETDFSFSAVVRDVGVQVKKFDDRSETVPYDVQLGLSKGFAHAPIRLSLTLPDLTRWSSSYYYTADGSKTKALQQVLNHLVVGVDIMPSQYFYLSAGYNFRRAYELKAAGKSRGAGLTFGGGIKVRRFRADLSYARYHAAASSFTLGVAYAL